MDSDVKLCQGKDIFERMNYLYQASHLMALKNRVAASCYGNMMVGCAKKSVLRIESDIKKTICKCCQSPLIPGETAKVRLISKPVKGVKWTCLVCLSVKKYPTKKGHKLWTEQDNSVIQIFNYAPRSKVINSDPNAKTKDSTSGKGRSVPTEETK
ncbi:ribonuclease P protein subunit Rpp21 [Lasioglossum baleicum]|uniref:ribonuclease P protein subunit Rpp21 n=1 Tax=Lasioglossum baleicum TaxID=434251 RepID=UPI003FCE1CF4